MLVKHISGKVYDVFANPTRSDVTGWEPSLWVRVHVTPSKKVVSYMKGNKDLMKQVSYKLFK